MEHLTEYERKRQENIERNQKMLAALGVHHTAQDLRSATKKPKSETKGFKISKRERESEPTIIRRSLRTRGISPEILKGLEMDSPSSKTPHKSFHVIAPEVPVSEKNGPLSFAETYVEHRDRASNALCLCWLKDIMDNVPLADLKCTKPSQPSEGGGAGYSPGDLKLKSKNIVRVCPSRIFCVDFLPCRDKVIVVSGDKEGHLSLWDADCSEEEGDGLHIYRPHSSPISGIAVEPFSLTKWEKSKNGSSEMDENRTKVHTASEPVESALTAASASKAGKGPSQGLVPIEIFTSQGCTTSPFSNLLISKLGHGDM